MDPNYLVILGSSVTALAIIRDAYKLKLKTILIDSVSEVAMSSRLPEQYHVIHADDVMPLMTRICTNNDVWLIATSDFWLRYIVDHRESLEDLLDKILHPNNDCLNICLDKQKFCSFCNSLEIPTPPIIKSISIRNGTSEATYPLFMRPLSIPDGSDKRIVPKAIEINTREEGAFWLNEYGKVNAEPLITQSLLNRHLMQLSVGFARNGGQMNCFVAIKRRPLPSACAVGTFVEKITDPIAETMANTLVESLDYYGIGEVEILKDISSGEYFVIEVNARPWVQYSLGPATGYPLLGLLLDKTSAQQIKKGCWIDLTSDTFCCLSRSMGHVRKGDVEWFTWMKDLLRVRNFAYFDVHDLKPAWNNLLDFLKR